MENLEMIRMSDAIARHQDRKAKGEEGFTLIELLVVVIIIGILAAIAIPVYVNVQNSAKDKTAQSDLASAKTAVIAYYADGNTVAATKTLLQPYGFVESVASTVTIVASTTAGLLCISAQSQATGTPTWYVTSVTAPSKTACTAAA